MEEQSERDKWDKVEPDDLAENCRARSLLVFLLLLLVLLILLVLLLAFVVLFERHNVSKYREGSLWLLYLSLLLLLLWFLLLLLLLRFLLHKQGQIT